jgi:hypothetical protein
LAFFCFFTAAHFCCRQQNRGTTELHISRLHEDICGHTLKCCNGCCVEQVTLTKGLKRD